MNETAEPIHVALAGGDQHRAGAKEQQALEQRVVEDVKQRRGEGQRRRQALAIGLKRQRQPEADKDDADILDGRIGQQPFEVALHQRIENTHHRGDAAERQHHHARGPIRTAEQIEHHADEAVDRHLGHHAAHQRRDVTGRGRMGQRQPDMERHQAGLGARAKQHQHQHQGRRGAGMRRGADGVKAVVAGGTGEEAKRQQQRQRAKTGHHQIDIAGLRIAALAMMRHHQRPRRQRHEFPAQEIRERIVGEQHQIHAGQKRREERQHALRRVFMAAIAERIEAGERAAEIDHHQEERRQRVEPEMRAEPWQADRQHQALDRGAIADQGAQGTKAGRAAQQQRPAIDHGIADPPARQHHRQHRDGEQRADITQLQGGRRHHPRRPRSLPQNRRSGAQHARRWRSPIRTLCVLASPRVIAAPLMMFKTSYLIDGISVSP